VVALLTAQGIAIFVPRIWEAVLEQLVFITAEVILAMHLVPYVLLTRTRGRWMVPLVPVARAFAWIVWPLRAGLDVAVQVLHLSDPAEKEGAHGAAEPTALEALVEAAEEEGILKRDQAALLEQLVEFSDKRVREVMTPRPDIIGIPSTANVEELRRVLVETKFSRIPVYDASLDEIIGIAYARDILHIPEREAGRRSVRELARPALFVPETKLGSHLLKEMQQKRQQMAVVIDEYGSVAGLVTVEDLVEEIVGEIGEEDRPPMPDVVREAGGTLVVRGSVALEKLRELVGAELAREGCATVAGLLNAVAGHVPVPGESLEFENLRFEVLEANQRKVLRLRVRRKPEAVQAAEAR